MQSAEQKVRFTYDDYLHIPGDKRYEIIDGDLRMTPSPFTKHQQIETALTVLLGSFVRERGLGKLIASPMDVVLSEEDVVQPDVLFISKKRLGILTEKHVRGAPDLVVEVLSKSSVEWDRQVKRKLYEKYGVGEYWMVDPEARSVEILVRESGTFKTFEVMMEQDSLHSPLFPNFSLKLSELFE